ncbi:hypothetical protein BYT27DRAFT_6436351 [Phlegmacium glaucopus]|nr:hypothetical protein BYT27DRAFT_6436351 [Phlegmacium glaucopus]
MASPSSIAPWTPAPGRHAFNIGPALAKALKARKLKASPGSTATAKRSNLPERDFYSFRFNFKPPSIDTTKPASIEIQKSADNTKVLAEYPSTQVCGILSLYTCLMI